jgi:hypothetical protein
MSNSCLAHGPLPSLPALDSVAWARRCCRANRRAWEVNLRGPARNLLSGLVATVCAAGVGSGAAADDFIAQCMKGETVDAQRICTCISEKIDAKDRPNALAAMTKVNESTAKGEEVNASTLTPEMIQGISAVTDAETKCVK